MRVRVQGKCMGTVKCIGQGNACMGTVECIGQAFDGRIERPRSRMHARAVGVARWQFRRRFADVNLRARMIYGCWLDSCCRVKVNLGERIVDQRGRVDHECRTSPCRAAQRGSARAEIVRKLVRSVEYGLPDHAGIVMPTLQALCSHFSMAGGQATAWFFEGIVEGGIEAGGAKSSPRKLVELIEHKVLRGQPVVVMALLSTEAQVHNVVRRPNLHLSGLQDLPRA